MEFAIVMLKMSFIYCQPLATQAPDSFILWPRTCFASQFCLFQSQLYFVKSSWVQNYYWNSLQQAVDPMKAHTSRIRAVLQSAYTLLYMHTLKMKGRKNRIERYKIILSCYNWMTILKETLTAKSKAVPGSFPLSLRKKHSNFISFKIL